jgi:hypothetical protein
MDVSDGHRIRAVTAGRRRYGLYGERIFNSRRQRSRLENGAGGLLISKSG